VDQVPRPLELPVRRPAEQQVGDVVAIEVVAAVEAVIADPQGALKLPLEDEPALARREARPATRGPQRPLAGTARRRSRGCRSRRSITG